MSASYQSLDRLEKERLIVVDEVDSTNTILSQGSLDEYPPGTALLARSQVQGRGRAGRVWDSQVGGMYLSVLYQPSSPEGLMLLGALCVVEYCRECLELPAMIRWPNDVYLQGKKLAGVLPQAKFVGQRLERVVLGIGLNVSQNRNVFCSEVKSRATTLSHHTQNCPTVLELAQQLLSRLDREMDVFERDGCTDLLRRCEVYLDGKCVGQQAALTEDGSASEPAPLGPILGLGKRGQLLLGNGTELEHLGPKQRLTLVPHFPPLA